MHAQPTEKLLVPYYYFAAFSFLILLEYFVNLNILTKY